jgi:nucleoside 2-deoxyribosyltransferase
MAMKFGRPITETLYRECFKPAVAQTGFELRRLDENPKAGLIDHRMEVLIRTAKFLIADLTYGNRGAYWEAGFATGLGRHVFYTCEKGRFRRVSTHFDVNHHYTVLWEADRPSEAAEELKAAIRATLPGDAKLTDS